MNWAVETARQALSAAPDWPAILVRVASLWRVCALSGWLATRAFRRYQRSV